MKINQSVSVYLMRSNVLLFVITIISLIAGINSGSGVSYNDLSGGFNSSDTTLHGDEGDTSRIALLRQKIRDVQALHKNSLANGALADALAARELIYLLSDSLMTAENSNQLMKERFTTEFAYREALILAKQETENAVQLEKINRKKAERNVWISGVLLLSLLSFVFAFQRKQIARAKSRSDELLLNILPAEIAEELKNDGVAKTREHKETTIMYTDFKGFTALSEKLSAEEVLDLINECFIHFDGIIEKYGAEKIKTIGDAYMAASGVPAGNQSKPGQMVRAALEIAQFMEDFKKRHDPSFEIRIGLNTGTVVAGIVGVKKYQYDLWGNAVGLAAMAESSGAVGKVTLTAHTFELVRHEFICEPVKEINEPTGEKIWLYEVLQQKPAL